MNVEKFSLEKWEKEVLLTENTDDVEQSDLWNERNCTGDVEDCRKNNFSLNIGMQMDGNGCNYGVNIWKERDTMRDGLELTGKRRLSLGEDIIPENQGAEWRESTDREVVNEDVGRSTRSTR